MYTSSGEEQRERVPTPASPHAHLLAEGTSLTGSHGKKSHREEDKDTTENILVLSYL